VTWSNAGVGKWSVAANWSPNQVSACPVSPMLAELPTRPHTGEQCPCVSISPARSPLQVPGPADTAVVSTGTVQLDADPTVASLNLGGTGAIQTGISACGAGWESHGGKCYKPFASRLDWKDAQYVCQSYSSLPWYNCMERLNRESNATDEHENLADRISDSKAWKGLPNKAREDRCAMYQDGHLSNVGSAEEAIVTHRQCRALGRSMPDCWIGLSENITIDRFQQRAFDEANLRTEGKWVWSDHASTFRLADARFTQWARGQPDNGKDRLDEHCVVVQSRTISGFALNRGEWRDYNCDSKRPFVCTTPDQSTTTHAIRVTSAFTWEGGAIKGNGQVLVDGTTSIETAQTKYLTTGKLVTVQTVSWISGDIEAGEGAVWRAQGPVNLPANSMLKNAAAGSMPTLEISSGGSLNKAQEGTVQVNVSLSNYGTVSASEGRVSFLAGGLSHSASQFAVTIPSYVPNPATECDVLFNVTVGGVNISQTIDGTNCVLNGTQLFGHAYRTITAATATLCKEACNREALAPISPCVAWSWFAPYQICELKEGAGLAESHINITSGMSYKKTSTAINNVSISIDGERVEFIHPETQRYTVGTLLPVLDTPGTGHYKLSFGGSTTTCLDYHSTAAAVQAALNLLHTVKTAGGVMVSRNGDADSALWQFGYSYDLSFGKSNNFIDLNLVQITSQGRSEGCNDVYVAANALLNQTIATTQVMSEDTTSQVNTAYHCPITGGSAIDATTIPAIHDTVWASPTVAAKHSQVIPLSVNRAESKTGVSVYKTHLLPSVNNTFVCKAQPIFVVTEVVKGGETQVTGHGNVEMSDGTKYQGALQFTAGSHHMMHVVPVRVEIYGGEVSVASNSFSFDSTVRVEGGVFALSGTGFEGLDAAYLMYQPVDYDGRQSSKLLKPNTIVGAIGDLQLIDGTIRVIGHDSQMAVRNTFNWARGVLSGTCTLTAEHTMNLNTAGTKQMRNAFQIITPNKATWTGGHLVASEGAQMVNTGLFYIYTGADWLLPVAPTPTRQWNQGWYPSPECVGPFCGKAPVFTNEGYLKKFSGSESRCDWTFDNNGIVEVAKACQLTLDANGTMAGEEIVLRPIKHPVVVNVSNASLPNLAMSNVSNVSIDMGNLTYHPQCICTDICPYANNGICEDGGPGVVADTPNTMYTLTADFLARRSSFGGAGFSTTGEYITLPYPDEDWTHHFKCALGTDCGDCGPTTRTQVVSNTTCGCKCNNTCPFAGNGVCQDGGPGSVYDLWKINPCAPGSDCDDCGPSNRTALAPGEDCAWIAPINCSNTSDYRAHNSTFCNNTVPFVYIPPDGSTIHRCTCGVRLNVTHHNATTNRTNLTLVLEDQEPCFCNNTCTYANNGICEDGGPGSDPTRSKVFRFDATRVPSVWEELKCALGSDCNDCGPSTRENGTGTAPGEVCPESSDDGVQKLQMKFRTAQAYEPGERLELFLPPNDRGYNFSDYPFIFFVTPAGARASAYWQDPEDKSSPTFNFWEGPGLNGLDRRMNLTLRLEAGYFDFDQEIELIVVNPSVLPDLTESLYPGPYDPITGTYNKSAIDMGQFDVSIGNWYNIGFSTWNLSSYYFLSQVPEFQPLPVCIDPCSSSNHTNPPFNYTWQFLLRNYTDVLFEYNCSNAQYMPTQTVFSFTVAKNHTNCTNGTTWWVANNGTDCNGANWVVAFDSSLDATNKSMLHDYPAFYTAPVYANMAAEQAWKDKVEEAARVTAVFVASGGVNGSNATRDLDYSQRVMPNVNVDLKLNQTGRKLQILEACHLEMFKVKETFLDCDCYNSTPYVHPWVQLPDDPAGDFYMPKYTSGFILSDSTSRLRFGAGQCTIESQFIMGPGVVVFSGGRHTIQIPEIDAEMQVMGGTVIVESDTFAITDANTREDMRYNASNRYRFSLHDGHINFTAIAPQFKVNGNMLVEGGVLQYPVENSYSGEHRARRGLVHVANRFTWKGGTCDGNADLQTGGGMFVGGVTKFLKNLWHVINYGDAYWTTGNIENHPGATFINRGSLEYDETLAAPSIQTAPTQETHRHKGSQNFIHSWDDF
jgi:hypothetical protein